MTQITATPANGVRPSHPALHVVGKTLLYIVLIAVALVTLFLRVKLMERAWHGRKFDLPLIEKLIGRYY